MGYALFAQQKLVLYGLVNSIQLQQTQRADEQMDLATKTLNMQKNVSNLQEAQDSTLSGLYELLAGKDYYSDAAAGSITDITILEGAVDLPGSTKYTDAQLANRSSIMDQIRETEAWFDEQIATIKGSIYATSIKENVIEMEVKRLDTKLTALMKQLEKIEEAESNGIDKATPQFKGLG